MSYRIAVKLHRRFIGVPQCVFALEPIHQLSRSELQGVGQ